MFAPILEISQFIVEAFLHIWPYLLVTIPLAVAVQMSGASKYIKRAFEARPLTAIVLATIVGAFSPFCSCGVIPVIASLLISGVPLAPVMSFWIASPSMDPEIFFFKRRNGRLGAGGLAFGGHAGVKFRGGLNYSPADAKWVAGKRNSAHAQSDRGTGYRRFSKERLARA